MGPGARRKVAVATLERPGHCCPHLHEAVELIGKRWSGAIVYVLLNGGPMRFTEIGGAVPQLSDRLLSERMKELEARGIVERQVQHGAPGARRVLADRDGPRARARAAQSCAPGRSAGSPEATIGTAGPMTRTARVV